MYDRTSMYNRNLRVFYTYWSQRNPYSIFLYGISSDFSAMISIPIRTPEGTSAGKYLMNC